MPQPPPSRRDGLNIYTEIQGSLAPSLQDCNVSGGQVPRVSPGATFNAPSGSRSCGWLRLVRSHVRELERPGKALTIDYCSLITAL